MLGSGPPAHHRWRLLISLGLNAQLLQHGLRAWCSALAGTKPSYELRGGSKIHPRCAARFASAEADARWVWIDAQSFYLYLCRPEGQQAGRRKPLNM